MVTCGLTAFTPGSTLGPTLSIEYGKPFPVTFTQALPGPIGRAYTGWPQTWKNWNTGEFSELGKLMDFLGNSVQP